MVGLPSQVGLTLRGKQTVGICDDQPLSLPPEEGSTGHAPPVLGGSERALASRPEDLGLSPSYVT